MRIDFAAPSTKLIGDFQKLLRDRVNIKDHCCLPLHILVRFAAIMHLPQKGLPYATTRRLHNGEGSSRIA